MNKEKAEIRKKAREKRKLLSVERRASAASRLIEILEPRLKGPTLSFASFGDEIDLWPLNEILAQKKLLLLPGGDHTKLSVFSVENPRTQLEKTKKGYLAPKEDLCEAFSFDRIEFVLVPGLIFDENGDRIGYGGGFYDRLLATFHARKIGVAFTEQLWPTHLPHEPHDIRVDELILV